MIGKNAYFGEVLGKHSEIYGDIEEGDITKIDLDSKTVEKVAQILGDNWSGFDPLDYIRYECSECEDSFPAEEFNFERNMCVWCIEDEKSKSNRKNISYQLERRINNERV